MRVFNTMLGHRPVRIYAPRVGELSYDRFRETFPSGGAYGFDNESTWMNAQGPFAPDYVNRLLQFGTDDTAFVLRMDDPAQQKAALELLSDPTCGFISHTQIDAVAVFAAYGIDISDRLLDTHWLSIMTSPDDRKGGADLKAQATKHGMPELAHADKLLDARFEEVYRAAGLVKGKRAVAVQTLQAWGFDNISLDDPIYLGYAGLDAIAVCRLAPKLIAATDAPASLLNNERWLSSQATKIRQRGARVDQEWLSKLTQETVERVNEAGTLVKDLTGFTPSQDVRLKGYWTEHGADWSIFPATKNGGVSLSKDAKYLLLQCGLDDEGTKVAQGYIAYAEVLDRLRKTEAISHAMVDGRIHPTLLTVGTVTGRMAATDPNMQNFSKKDARQRGCFIPEDGHVFLSCDFAQIELRVLAALAQEQAMIDTILSGGDLHQLTADMLGITRQEAKTVNFLIVYGGGAGKLAAQLGYTRTVDECQTIIENYWSGYPAISEFKEFTKTMSEVRLISERRVPVSIDPKWGRPRVHANLNYEIQGSARELLGGAWRKFAAMDPDYASFVWFPVHDEMVLQCPVARVNEVKNAIQHCMTFDFRGVPIKADADELYDENGISRWMSGDTATEIREKLALAV